MRGLKPSPSIGFVRLLAKHFVVLPIAECYTSKTCARCLGSLVPDSTRLAKKKTKKLKAKKTKPAKVSARTLHVREKSHPSIAEERQKQAAQPQQTTETSRQGCSHQGCSCCCCY